MNLIERSARRIDAVQQGHSVPAFAFAVIKKYGDDNGGVLVSNLAWSGVASLFPLLLLLVTILGLVLADNPSARAAVLHSTLSQFPIVGTELGDNIHALKRSSSIGLAVGIVALIWTSTGLAQSGLWTMEQVWNLPGPARPSFVARLCRSAGFLGVLGLGVIVSTLLASFATFGRHNLALGVLGVVLAVVVNVVMYAAGLRLLTPKVIETRRLLPGAGVGGVGWTMLQAIGGYLVGHQLRGASATYGTFAAILGLLFWVYLGAELSVYAAEVNAVLARRLWPRALVQPPLTEADQRSLTLHAEQTQVRAGQTVTSTFDDPPMSQHDYLNEGDERPRPDPDVNERAST